MNIMHKPVDNLGVWGGEWGLNGLWRGVLTPALLLFPPTSKQNEAIFGDKPVDNPKNLWKTSCIKNAFHAIMQGKD